MLIWSATSLFFGDRKTNDHSSPRLAPKCFSTSAAFALAQEAPFEWGASRRRAIGDTGKPSDLGRHVCPWDQQNLVLLARLLRRQADEFVHVAPHALKIVRSAIKATIVLLGMMVATDISIVAASLFAGDAHFLTFLTGVLAVFTDCLSGPSHRCADVASGHNGRRTQSRRTDRHRSRHACFA